MVIDYEELPFSDECVGNIVQRKIILDCTHGLHGDFKTDITCFRTIYNSLAGQQYSISEFTKCRKVDWVSGASFNLNFCTDWENRDDWFFTRSKVYLPIWGIE